MNGAAALFSGDFGEVLRQPQHGCHTRGIISGAFEPSVAVSDHKNGFVAGSRQRAPHRRGLQIGHRLHVQADFDARRLAAPRLTDQIADRDSVLQAQRERRNRAANRVELGPQIAG